MSGPGNLDEMRRIYGPATWDIYAELEQSLAPRGPDLLHDLAAHHAPTAARILDVGCRDAAHTLDLLTRLEGSTALGVDPVPVHVERARRAAHRAGLEHRLDVREGVMQQVPAADGSFDLVWCRDVVEQVDRLDEGLRELRRVIAPTGRLIVSTVFVTDLLEPREAAMLQRSRGNVWANLHRPAVESAFAGSGFSIESADDIDTEWREHAEEQGPNISTRLLSLGRLRRRRQEIVRDHGQDLYDHVEANLHWEVYQFIGKLRPVVYVLRPVGPDRRLPARRATEATLAGAEGIEESSTVRDRSLHKRTRRYKDRV